MNSLLALALVAPAVLANPIRRQATTGTFSLNATTTLAPTTVITDTSLPSDTLTDTSFPTETFTESFPITSTWGPVPTGGSDRGYYYCYFPGSEPVYSETYTDVYTDTFTDTFIDTFTDVPTDTFTDIPTETASLPEPTTDVPTETVPVPTDTSSEPSTVIAEPTATVSVTFTDTDLTTPIPTATEFTLTDLPTTTVAPTDYPYPRVSTYTIVGPPGQTQVIECIRVPRWGGHPHPPVPHPPHHPHPSGPPTGTFITSLPPTALPTFTFTASTFLPSETDTATF